MRLKKNLIQLVESDYTPLQTNQEGLLLGGFGTMTVVAPNSIDINANLCKNGNCPNPICSNQCTINNCTVATTSPTTSPSPSPSPSPANACSFLSF